MSPDVLALAKRGSTSKGVPYLALPPEGTMEARRVVVLWHGADPPRSEEALAAAVPMREVPAWRIYLGMPLYSSRAPAGGFEEIMRRATEDAVTLMFHPSIGGAVNELPVALDDIRTQLGIDASLPLGIFGFSQGGAAALLAVARRAVRFRAAVTFGAVVDLPNLVNGLSTFYGTTYEWTDQRRALAEELSSTDRAPALVRSRAHLLLAVGAEDPYPIRESTERLAADIHAQGGAAELRIVPDLKHAFVDEPGVEAAPQGQAARAIDELASRWFLQHLI